MTSVSSRPLPNGAASRLREDRQTPVGQSGPPTVAPGLSVSISAVHVKQAWARGVARDPVADSPPPADAPIEIRVSVRALNNAFCPPLPTDHTGRRENNPGPPAQQAERPAGHEAFAAAVGRPTVPRTRCAQPLWCSPWYCSPHDLPAAERAAGRGCRPSEHMRSSQWAWRCCRRRYSGCCWSHCQAPCASSSFGCWPAGAVTPLAASRPPHQARRLVSKTQCPGTTPSQVHLGLSTWPPPLLSIRLQWTDCRGGTSRVSAGAVRVDK
jgi:hypothetical protein